MYKTGGAGLMSFYEKRETQILRIGCMNFKASCVLKIIALRYQAGSRDSPGSWIFFLIQLHPPV